MTLVCEDLSSLQPELSLDLTSEVVTYRYCRVPSSKKREDNVVPLLLPLGESDTGFKNKLKLAVVFLSSQNNTYSQ